MLVRLIGKDSVAKSEAKKVVESCGHIPWHDSMYYVDKAQTIDLTIAPLLTYKVPIDVINESQYGMLIFHPSALPYSRGASSIKWAYKRQEPIIAATWFWADQGLDTGNICQQEIIKIDYRLTPREFYNQDVVPAMCRTLKRCLNELSIGLKREIKQIEKYATFDRKI